jgi:hypothetical protein
MHGIERNSIAFQVTGMDTSMPHLRYRHLRLQCDGVESDHRPWIPAFGGDDDVQQTGVNPIPIALTRARRGYIRALRMRTNSVRR